MKIISLLVLVSLLTSFSFVKASDELSDNCAYEWEFQLCKQANKDGSTRGIEDFVCLSSNNSFDIMGQIILDKNFKEIDREVEEYLESLQKNKDYFFWPNAQQPFVDAVDEVEWIFSKYGTFWKKYWDVCSVVSAEGVLQQTLQCFWWVMPSVYTLRYFWWSDTSCQNLIGVKLEINKQVAYDILKLNKAQVKKDEDKKYFQKERDMYDTLLEIIMVNVGYLERIWKKWPSKTKDAH